MSEDEAKSLRYIFGENDSCLAGQEGSIWFHTMVQSEETGAF